ncbi:hypothetical protein ACHAWT_001053 [Skeletonema menzelii]
MGRLESLMKKLGKLPKDDSLDHVYKHIPLYYCVPAEPKKNPNRKTKHKPSELVKRRDQQRRHDQIVAQFNDNAKERINLHNKPGAKDEDRYSSKSNPKFACIHLHPEMLQHFTEQQFSQLPQTIPRALGQKLDREGTCSFRASDELPSSQSRDYIPLPNYPLPKADAYIKELEERVEVHLAFRDAQAAHDAAPARTRSGTAALQNPEVAEIEHLRRELNERAKMIDAKEELLLASQKKFNEETEARKKLDLEREMEYLQREKELNHKFEEVHRLLKDGGGLSRQTLFNPEWHEKNPKAANSLFGFTDYFETGCWIHALFGLLPPLEAPKPGDAMTEFEWMVAAKLRMNCGFSYTHIALIFGLKSIGHVSSKVQEAVKQWGEAGKSLSILDISEKFLEETCPQAYKDEGLTNICGIPDGKDFKINTPRKNSLLSRACYSDKVHASAVRCISWCTPMGLSYEHTDLFLARVSETALVELWGPRLRKCPKGWDMLSDRGFWNTARFYPNMNRQLTPKFLSGRKQFTAEEVSADRTICKLRYTCEVAFSRVTDTRGLQDVISQDFFVMLDAMNHWGHANVNIKKPLMPSHK